jgi:hypothetical protein
MRAILIDRGSNVGTGINAKIEDVTIAAVLLRGAASAAEADLAAHAWSPGVLAAAGPISKIIRACNELERALAGPAHTPSPTARAASGACDARLAV